MKPYYEDSLVTLWHGDCRELLPVVAPVGSVSLVLTDPQYGVSERTDRLSKGRSNATPSLDFPPVHDDDKPFDPSHLLAYPRLVLWGANYYSPRLPESSSWIVWDKRDGTTSDDNADCELAWTNLGGPARLFRHLWRGMIKASERGEQRQHPTQKPVALFAWIISQHTQAGDVVLDPYVGSGPTLRAAKDLRRKAIGIEIEERYCEIAAQRLTQEVLELGA